MELMQPHAMIRLALILLIVILVILGLSWAHILPGGWFLRDLIEDPQVREHALQQEHREERLEDFRREEPRVLGFANPVVFLGSSIIERFPLGKIFPQSEFLNRGIGGESAEELLARVDKSLPLEAWAKVKGVVLYAGSIDLRRGDSVAAIANRVRLLISRIQTLAPSSAILLLGIIPGRQNSPRSNGVELDTLNEGLRVLAEAMSVGFLPLDRKPLVDDEGCLSQDMSEDDWHPNLAGYRVIVSWLKENAKGF